MFSYYFYILVIPFINYLFKKKKYLPSHNGSEHQKFINVAVPLTGGIFLVFPIFFIFYEKFIFFSVVLFLIFLIGFLSDKNILSSPKKRFLLQLVLIFLFVFSNKLEVLPTRINFIDDYFRNTYVSYFFTIFCLMILINGSNFIDGLNGLLLGYCLIILAILYLIGLLDIFALSQNSLKFLFAIFFIVFLLNLFIQLFLGDGGAYSVSFFIGFILIYIYKFENLITPYFVILLLWYPCFENLFSIIRKIITKKNPIDPDNNHLHQYLFLYLKSKFNFRSIYANISSSILINLYNLLIFYWASKNPNVTFFQINLLFLNIVVYIVIYFLLRKSTFKEKLNH